MLQTFPNPLSRWFLACALLAAPLVFSSASLAQTNDSYAQMPPGAAPPPPQAGPPGVAGQQPGATGNPICQRLEGQLATIDRGGTGDPAKDEQIRRYQDAQARQQAELDRITQQGKRMGCGEPNSFFSIFNQQNSQCGPVNSQIQKMRGNLDQINTSLEQLRSGGLGGADRENQRRSVLTSLAQNNCGPQYAAALREQSQGGFLGGLFGGNNNATSVPGADLGAASGTFRTVCVRTCDGAYFPVSFATVAGRFADDEKTCKALCPAAEANLYTYRNPGEDMNQAVSTSGQPYTSLPTAFKFRSAFDPACACKAAGQTWSDALKSVDDKALLDQQGDIIVTEESAKKMQQQKMQAKGAQPAAGKKGQPAPPATTASTPPAPATTPPAAADGKDKPIRSVGPTFIPNNNTTTR